MSSFLKRIHRVLIQLYIQEKTPDIKSGVLVVDLEVGEDLDGNLFRIVQMSNIIARIRIKPRPNAILKDIFLLMPLYILWSRLCDVEFAGLLSIMVSEKSRQVK